jgi:hypothetical protein
MIKLSCFNVSDWISRKFKFELYKALIRSCLNLFCMQVKYKTVFLFEYSPTSGNKKRDWNTR